LNFNPRPALSTRTKSKRMGRSRKPDMHKGITIEGRKFSRAVSAA